LARLLGYLVFVAVVALAVLLVAWIGGGWLPSF